MQYAPKQHIWACPAFVQTNTSHVYLCFPFFSICRTYPCGHRPSAGWIFSCFTLWFLWVLSTARKGKKNGKGGGGASPQKVFPYPTWEVCTPLKNLNLIWINDSSVIEIKILNYSKYDWKQGFWTKENQKSHNFLGASPHYQLCLQTPTAACSAALRPPLNFGHPPEPNLKIRLWERRLGRGQVK